MSFRYKRQVRRRGRTLFLNWIGLRAYASRRLVHEWILKHRCAYTNNAFHFSFFLWLHNSSSCCCPCYGDCDYCGWWCCSACKRMTMPYYKKNGVAYNEYMYGHSLRDTKHTDSLRHRSKTRCQHVIENILNDSMRSRFDCASSSRQDRFFVFCLFCLFSSWVCCLFSLGLFVQTPRPNFRSIFGQSSWLCDVVVVESTVTVKSQLTDTYTQTNI